MNYSQNNEQQAILDYFGDFIGSFLDIGANDGQTLSNTRALAEKGWSGVLIEPSPEAYKRLKTLYVDRKKDIFTYPFAISDHNGTAILKESGSLLNNEDVGLVSTFHDSEQKRFISSVIYQPVEVKAFRWKTFYNRLKKVKEFDFISIDTEGNDLIILEQLDLSKTRLICLEWNGNEMLKHQFEQLLSGFKLIYTSGENLIYGK